MATPSFKFLRQNRTTAAVATAAGLAYFLYNITRADAEPQAEGNATSEPSRAEEKRANQEARANTEPTSPTTSTLAAAEEDFEADESVAAAGLAGMSDEKKAQLREQLADATKQIGTQMMDIQREMASMKSQLYSDSGLDGLKAQLEALKGASMAELQAASDGERTSQRHPQLEAARAKKGSEEKKDDGDEEDSGVLRENSKVDARWKGGKRFFPARIHRINADGSFDLHYADGGRERNVPAGKDLVRPRSAGTAAAFFFMFMFVSCPGLAASYFSISYPVS